jgi:hypothetical protein
MTASKEGYGDYGRRQFVILAKDKVFEKVEKQAKKDRRTVAYTIGYLLEKATKTYDGSVFLLPEEDEEEKK